MTCAFVPCPFIVRAELVPCQGLAFELVTSMNVEQLECSRKVFFNTMPTVPVEKHHTYAQSHGKLYIPLPFKRPISAGAAAIKSNDTVDNGMIPYLIYSSIPVTDANKYMLTMESTFPERGYHVNERSSDKIRVTSLQYKLKLSMDFERYLEGSIVPKSEVNSLASALLPKYWPSATDYAGATSSNIIRPIQFPPNPTQHFNLRFMVVRFDEDIAITEQKILSWFYSIYTIYRDPTKEPALPNFNVAPTLYNCTPPPCSTHCTKLRNSSVWTGKYTILSSHNLTLTSQTPTAELDITIPINKIYEFDDELYFSEISVNYLIRPHIYAFILPPLSWEVDMGFYDRYILSQINAAATTDNTKSTSFIDYTVWSKLNFVDI